MKNIAYSDLFVAYGKLLSKAQAEMTEMYYLFDLSLAEIAEIKGVTRQSVADTLKKARAELDKLETAIGYVEKKDKIVAFAEGLDGAKREALLSIVGK